MDTARIRGSGRFDCSSWTLLLLLVLAWTRPSIALGPESNPQQSLDNRPASAKQQPTLDKTAEQYLLCRLATQDTLFHDEHTGRFYGRQEVVCDPQQQHDNDDGVNHNLYNVVLPGALTVTAQELHQGDLWVNITAARVNHTTERVDLSPTSTFTRLSTQEKSSVLQHGHRRLGKAYDDATGIRTYAIMLISTTDASPTVTEQALRARYTNTQVGMQAQYKACSAEKLHWHLQGIYHQYLSLPMAAYGNSPSALRNAASQQFLSTRPELNHMEDLANNILYCIPPGTGTWVANAGTRYWRSQYNDAWCISLTAVVHELGHNLGLGHANENGQPYNDWTGYMASGLPDEDKPKKCFNAANNVQLGWYDDRVRTWTPDEGSQKVKVAAFVDYDETSVAEPVILSFGNNKFFGQYNLAAGHNVGTEEYKNEFVVVEQVEGATELRTHLAEGQSIRISGTTIHVCEKVVSSPRSLMIGIGTVPLVQSASLCNLPAENSPPTPPPTSRPTPEPTKPPTSTPPRRPTQQPTLEPTKKPTKPPTPSPTTSPSDKPTKPPTTAPSEKQTDDPTSTTTLAPTPALAGESDSADTVGTTESPTEPPTGNPTAVPTVEATLEEDAGGISFGESIDGSVDDIFANPTDAPSSKLSDVPSGEPSEELSEAPSDFPSKVPSALPSDMPSDVPTDTPSTEAPTLLPTQTVVETNAPVITMNVQPDGSVSELANDKEPDPTEANGFLDFWEKLALGTTWFEYFL